jgi:hypothetical protein
MRDSQTFSCGYGLIRFVCSAVVIVFLLAPPQSLAADTISITATATPRSVSAAGGTATITAKVSDAAGSPVAGVPVSFSADNGSLSAETATTDKTGTARVFLTTHTPTNVTATAGTPTTSPAPLPGASAKVTVNVSPLPTVSISATAPATPATTDPPSTASFTFTIRATPATGNTIVSVLVEYGDGHADSLPGNATIVTHAYSAAGRYTVTATATDNMGGSGSASTTIAILVGDEGNGSSAKLRISN